METGNLQVQLSSDGFDPEKYVQSLTVEGDDGLLEGRQKLQVIGDETKRALKKNVYDNYLKFIDAAKEISILEGEMYQLNHMLTEQKNVMTAIRDNSIASDKIEVSRDEDEDSHKNLAFLLEKVEGCTHIMEVAGRHLIHDGDLVELDPESYHQIQKCHMFLLNDCLMLATWHNTANNVSRRAGPVKYKYQAMYELDSLAVVNVRDVGPVKNAFKVLMFPDTRMYQTDNPKAKRQWLDYLEEVKKKKAAKDKARREAAAAAGRKKEPENTDDFSNPFNQPDLNPFEVESEKDVLAREGLREVPEDLDVLIAQRDFEGAVDKIEEVNAKLKDAMVKSPMMREYKSRIEQRIKQLTDILMQELSVPPERTMRSGNKSVRTAITQLIRLGKSAQACQLFLKNRSTVIHHNMRQLKIEGATSLYISKLSDTFFSTMTETCREFRRAFVGRHQGCVSGLVVWAKKELKQFTDIYKRQVFGSKAAPSSIADCVYIARSACRKLQKAGLDVEWLFNDMIHEDVERAVEDQIKNFLDACRQRASEDKWQPKQFPSKSVLYRFLDKMIAAGFTDIEELVYDNVYMSLTANSLQFCQSGMIFLEDLLKLNQPSVQRLVDSGIQKMWSCQLNHIEDSLTSALYIKENKFILKNAAWLEDKVLQMAKSKYLDSVGYDSSDMKHVHRSFGKLKSLAMAYQAELV